MFNDSKSKHKGGGKGRNVGWRKSNPEPRKHRSKPKEFREYKDPFLSGNFDPFNKDELQQFIVTPLKECRTFEEFTELAEWATASNLSAYFFMVADDEEMNDWIEELGLWLI